MIEESSEFFSKIHPGLLSVVLGIIGSICIFFYFVILYVSSGSTATSTLYRLIHERRVIFIVLLLGILFYVDNVYRDSNVGAVIFPIFNLITISFDLIVMYFPRRLALVTMILIVLVLCWNIFEVTFRKTDCKQYMLPWGIFGEDISYCSIRRLIYQSILSLMVSAAIAIFTGRTDNLFFCNINIYRSTGTIDRSSVNEKYVESMKMERERSIDADKSTVEVEMT